MCRCMGAHVRTRGSMESLHEHLDLEDATEREMDLRAMHA